MNRRPREHFGKAGLIVAAIALVFAMFGGAYAASNSSGGGKATASAAKKGPRGPKGPKGDTGPAGLTGPAGPAGPAGAKGDAGAAGANGSPGTAGASVTGEPIASGGACGAGVTGVKYTLSATSTNVCNGKAGTPGAAGPQGPKGDPWSAGGTLPEGATETGAWAGQLGEIAGEKLGLAAVTFAIPLANELNGAHVVNFAIATEPEKENCKNETHAGEPSPVNPEAAAGFLCIYLAAEFAGEFIAAKVLNIDKPNMTATGAGFTGAVLELSGTGFGGVTGTFAVTAP